MRYNDWDVLLFPEGCHVPFKEFKTTCYALRKLDAEGREVTDVDGDKIMKPLLTCFTPAVQCGSHFTISVHAWLVGMHPAMLDGDNAYKKYFWQVRVIIDGNCVATRHFPARCSWPQVISTTGGVNTAGQPLGPPLKWPPYPKSAATQQNWDAASDSGRIKVELSSGYTIQVGEQVSYNKLTDVVCFSFFPAPIDHLERVGIAWPNLPMFAHPLGAPPGNESTLAPAFDGNGPNTAMHKRNISQGSIHFSSPLRSLPQPPPPTPVTGLHHYQLQTGDVQSNYDTSSRSTSGYTNGVDITNTMPFGFGQEYSLPNSRQVQVRLPSDQLQQIINAMHPFDYRQHSVNAAQMPPPPVPARAIAPKPDDSFGERLSTARDANRRGDIEARSSDISMHPGCTSYPTCLVENDQGQIVHSSPATPSTTIKGRKEGDSSPTKPARDFMSTILDPTAEGQVPIASTEPVSLTSSSPADSGGRKRTRSALRSLALNTEGSPEKKEVTKKPPRKASKASISSGVSDSAKSKSDGNILVDPVEDKENMMVDV